MASRCTRALLPMLLSAVVAHSPHDIISGLVAHEDGMKLITISRGLVFRSENAGHSWEQCQEGLPNPLPQNSPGTIISHGDTVFLMSNYGSGAGGEGEERRPISGLGVPAMFRSKDFGKTWTHTAKLPLAEFWMLHYGSKQSLARRICISPNYDQDKKVLVAGNRLALSHDEGKSWEPVTSMPDSAPFWSVLCTENGFFGATRDGKLYRSNAGLNGTWTHVLSPLNVPEVDDSIFLYAGHGNLPDRGKSVVMINNEGITNVSFGSDGAITGTDTMLTKAQIKPCCPGLEGHMVGAVFNSGTILSSSDYKMFRRAAGSDEWRIIGKDEGFKAAILQSSAEGYPSITSYAIAKNTQRVYCGSYTGVYRSDDEGASWTKLDTLMPYVTGLTVARGRVKGAKYTVGVCTYTAGCFQAQMGDVGGKLQILGEVKDEMTKRLHIPGKEDARAGGSSITMQRYLQMMYSPDFENDGIVLTTSYMVGLARSTDGGETFTSIADQLPPDDPEGDATAHTIVFSPNFKDDGCVFIGGYNIGLRKSVDKGKTFTLMPLKVNGDVQTFKVFATYMKFTVPPNFNNNIEGRRTIVVHYRSDIDQAGGDAAELTKKVDANLAWMAQWNASSWIARSEDGGATWERLGQQVEYRDVTFVGKEVPRLWTLRSDSDGVAFMTQVMLRASVYVGDQGGEHDGGFEPITMNVSSDSMHQQLGPNGFSVSPSGDHIVLPFLRGGVITGKPDSVNKALVDGVQCLPDETPAGKIPIFVQTLLPQDDSFRGMGRLIKHSRDFDEDGTIFGVYGLRIMASRDRGHTWDTVAKLKQYIDEPKRMGPGMTNCEAARNSEEPVFPHMDNWEKAQFNDGGSYCLQCKEGHTRDVEMGTCGDMDVSLPGKKKDNRLAGVALHLHASATGRDNRHAAAPDSAVSGGQYFDAFGAHELVEGWRPGQQERKVTPPTVGPVGKAAREAGRSFLNLLQIDVTDDEDDAIAAASASSGVLFGLVGLLTGLVVGLLWRHRYARTRKAGFSAPTEQSVLIAGEQ